jgi:hypothetical protein
MGLLITVKAILYVQGVSKKSDSIEIYAIVIIWMPERCAEPKSALQHKKVFILWPPKFSQIHYNYYNVQYIFVWSECFGDITF